MGLLHKTDLCCDYFKAVPFEKGRQINVFSTGCASRGCGTEGVPSHNETSHDYSDFFFK